MAEKLYSYFIRFEALAKSSVSSSVIILSCCLSLSVAFEMAFIATAYCFLKVGNAPLSS